MGNIKKRFSKFLFIRELLFVRKRYFLGTKTPKATYDTIFKKIYSMKQAFIMKYVQTMIIL